MKSKCLFKEIPLHPTKFHVDVWVCDDLNITAKYFNKRYGGSIEAYKEEISPNQVADIEATESSDLKGSKRIVMNIQSFDIPILIHELNHVIYHLAKLCNLETNYDSQEWISYMLEYLFEQCQDKKSFKSL